MSTQPALPYAAERQAGRGSVRHAPEIFQHDVRVIGIRVRNRPTLSISPEPGQHCERDFLGGQVAESSDGEEVEMCKPVLIGRTIYI